MRVSLLPRHVVAAMSPKEQAATVALEWHVGFRATRVQDPLDIRDGHAHTFLTIGHFQRCLRESGSRWIGEDFAAECLNTILPRLKLIADAGTTRKPELTDEQKARREKFAPNTPTPGRVVSRFHSYWWREFQLLTFPKLIVSAFGVWTERFARSRISQASLVGLLRCQELERPNRSRRRFAPGSVQAAFQATGPP